MKLFVAWTNREEPYHYVTRGCRVLVSPNNVSQAWQCKSWTSWPDELLIDSGAYQRDGGVPSAEAILTRQLAMIADAPNTCRVFVSHADCRLDLRTYAPGRWKEGFEESLARARELASAKREGQLGCASPLGVIQGFDETSVWHASRRLQDLGYRHFGIGSLVPLVHTDVDRMLRLIDAALESGCSPLHVFGVSAPSAIPHLKQAGVDSIDASTPIREAMNGSIDYARPFRRFQVPGSRMKSESLLNYGFRVPLKGFLPCDCAVCRTDPSPMLRQDREGKAARACHNYWQLRLEVEEN